MLRIENLHVNYGAIRALHGVSLEIERGEIVTLIGANGAGKTTLLKTISGLIRPADGSIQLDPDIALEHLPAHRIVAHGICQVPEGRQIFPQMTVRENLVLGAYQRKDRAEIQKDVRHAYELFPILEERRQQKAGTLSGGEQQMLAIGRALMARPKLLLLDEPSLGLAPLIVRKIFEIIRQINRAGTTIFLVEQNAHMALNVANRAYVLQTGEIIQSGKAADLLADPQVKEAYLGG
ncbi:MAG TPA: ABC transporter ATP-binding protein [Tepidisphaeraceae bacterium]|nr:ABC transporter ATP-binding protein [Tepidisphaeraceae bacterium]